MNSKSLVLLCDNYPNSNGEFFLDDEVDVIAERFENVFIVCMSTPEENRRPVPQNVSVINFTRLNLFQHIVFRLLGLFFFPLWKELFTLKENYDLLPSFLLFKILWADYVNSSALMALLKEQQLVNAQKYILYSYWHDYKALAIARLKKSNDKITSVARGHGWDVDYKRHHPQYLPFKNFIVSNLSLTVSISEFGKKMLQEVTDSTYHDKIKVSRLGKRNDRVPFLEKIHQSEFLICSCSSIIPLKRVEKIIHFVEFLNVQNLKWVHFGSGPQMEQMINIAEKCKVNADFMGNVSNNKILDFYSKNYVDLFVNFSESEGIPVSIMEAQSAGIPVLATDVGGVSEIVNNQNGFLVDKNFDMAQTVTMIHNFLNGSPEIIKQKRQAAHENWRENYNAEKNYNEFYNLLTRM